MESSGHGKGAACTHTTHGILRTQGWGCCTLCVCVCVYITHGILRTWGWGCCTLCVYVLVITPLRGMLPVYRPEGRGPINRNIPIRGVIMNL